MKNKIFKFLFPKEYRALREAFIISHTYWMKSPDFDKREIGGDIYTRLSKILTNNSQD